MNIHWNLESRAVLRILARKSPAVWNITRSLRFSRKSGTTTIHSTSAQKSKFLNKYQIFLKEFNENPWILDVNQYQTAWWSNSLETFTCCTQRLSNTSRKNDMYSPRNDPQFDTEMTPTKKWFLEWNGIQPWDYYMSVAALLRSWIAFNISLQFMWFFPRQRFCHLISPFVYLCIFNNVKNILKVFIIF